MKVPGSYPSEENINNFLWKTLTLDARNLFNVLSQKVKQNVLVSFIEECDVIQLENKICKGVIFPGTDSKVDSFSVDTPIITVLLRNLCPMGYCVGFKPGNLRHFFT